MKLKPTASLLTHGPTCGIGKKEAYNMIERDFDVAFVADLARREKQIQQNYRPIIAVHKWFARRPGTLFRALLLSEFVKGKLRETYYEGHNLRELRVADPFMGGGTPLLEANRIGCDVVGVDINPMAAWIVRREIENLDLPSYAREAENLRSELEKQIGHLYRTKCLKCGFSDAHVKYFLWVKVQRCRTCHEDIDLFKGYLVAENRRHPKNVFLCAACGNLIEVADRRNPGNCQFCGTTLSLKGPAERSRCKCPHCGSINIFPDASLGPPRHRIFAIEYYCPLCKGRHRGRFFKRPDAGDVACFADAQEKWARLEKYFIPSDQIPRGDETDRLHRWGYQRYTEMFNERQLLGLELSCQAIVRQQDERIRNALATNLSDLLRYQNMLCRYDTMALKSLDIFSVHGFPVSLIQCESNLLGIPKGPNGANIGSGGWSNIIDKYIKAKTFCDTPFEINHRKGHKVKVLSAGEWIGDLKTSDPNTDRRVVELYSQDAAKVALPPESLDGVFTDPPYFGNVQYAELMDFCYVWLRRLVGSSDPSFSKRSTRDRAELTGNINMKRGLDHFTEGLSRIFQGMARALKPGAPFVFTYHHNELEAYYPIAVAILDSGLTCSAALPCPAEMRASIHINGTGSSTIDTIFVCRMTGVLSSKSLAASPQGVAELIADDLSKLIAGRVRPSPGDIRCIGNGHLIRLAIWSLRREWDPALPTKERLKRVVRWIDECGGPRAVGLALEQITVSQSLGQKPIHQQYDA